MKPLNQSTIIICSIVRNAEKGLKKNIPVINALCNQAKDYKIIVFENNSQDQTKTILKDWQKKIGDTHFFLSMYDVENSKVIPSEKEVIANPFFSQVRISKMVMLRNQYMDYIEKKNLMADYLIVVDLDVAKLSLKGILSSFETAENWDAITANGYSLSPKLRRRYHDTYALTEWGKERQALNESTIRLNAEKYRNLKKGTGLIRVFSAFGGLAIYRFNAVKGLKYKLLYNDDDRVEVKCEHYSIYAQMQEAGFDKVYINPMMEIKYQSVSWNIIKKTFKRWISK